MNNITYFNEVAKKETGRVVPSLAQDGMTEEYHEYLKALSNHISTIEMSDADHDVLVFLACKVVEEARKSGCINGFINNL